MAIWVWHSKHFSVCDSGFSGGTPKAQSVLCVCPDLGLPPTPLTRPRAPRLARSGASMRLSVQENVDTTGPLAIRAGGGEDPGWQGGRACQGSAPPRPGTDHRCMGAIVAWGETGWAADEDEGARRAAAAAGAPSPDPVRPGGGRQLANKGKVIRQTGAGSRQGAGRYRLRAIQAQGAGAGRRRRAIRPRTVQGGPGR